MRAAPIPTWPNGRPRSMNNAFAILYAPRAKADAHQAPKKTGPKPSKVQQAASALMTEGERKAARILRDNSRLSINVTSPSLADKDKTARIMGRRNRARSQ